jgi:hypothetical protein
LLTCCRILAIADKYGEGTTAKAVSTRFERLKKEPEWNLANSLSASNGNGAGANGTPAKTKTPRKPKNPASAAAAAPGSSNEDDDETFEKKPTPRKSNLNKTQGGRVSKPQTPRKNGAGSSFNTQTAAINLASDDEDDEVNFKQELAANGNGDTEAMNEDGGDIYNTGYQSDGDMV